jgi:hypothetical protein
MHGLSKPPDGNFQCSIKAQKSAVSIFQANRKPVQRFKNGAGYPPSQNEKIDQRSPCGTATYCIENWDRACHGIVGPRHVIEAELGPAERRLRKPALQSKEGQP